MSKVTLETTTSGGGASVENEKLRDAFVNHTIQTGITVFFNHWKSYFWKQTH